MQWAAFLTHPKRWWCPPLRRALLLGVIACAGITLPVAALRTYQYRAAGTLVQAVVAAPLETLDVQIEALGDGRVRLSLPGLAGCGPLPPEALGMPVRSQYLVIAFEDTGRPAIPLTLRYVSGNPQNDFTRTGLVLPPALSTGNGAGSTLGRVFTPVFELSSDAYEDPDHRFLGIELSAEHLPYLRGVSRVTDASKLPVLINLSLPHDWERRPLRQGFLW